ncbi:MAG: hypothetical protein OK454_03750 [Thaumarchaeota archaeon]|nr:hypothetical protein [Nitrososphaerota archaeon]
MTSRVANMAELVYTRRCEQTGNSPDGPSLEGRGFDSPMMSQKGWEEEIGQQAGKGT